MSNVTVLFSYRVRPPARHTVYYSFGHQVCIARRTVGLPTEKVAESCSSVGSCRPSANSPLRIASRIRAASSRYAMVRIVRIWSGTYVTSFWASRSLNLAMSAAPSGLLTS